MKISISTLLTCAAMGFVGMWQSRSKERQMARPVGEVTGMLGIEWRGKKAYNKRLIAQNVIGSLDPGIRSDFGDYGVINGKETATAFFYLDVERLPELTAIVVEALQADKRLVGWYFKLDEVDF